MKTAIKYIVFIYFCTTVCWSRKHNLNIVNDTRKYVALSTFGFYAGGKLEVKLINFRATPENDMAVFGFSLDRTMNDGLDLDGHKHCILEEGINNLNNDDIVIYFRLDLKNKKLRMICARDPVIHTYNNASQPISRSCNNSSFNITSTVKDGQTFYNASFTREVKTSQEEGLYSLYFHSCPNYNPNTETLVNFTVEIIEVNPNSYLSSGEIQLSVLYCVMSLVFLLSGILWVFLLKKSKHPLFKIYYMMTILVFLKAVSLALHGVNYYYIERLGVHLATWAVLFYIVHLVEGVLFIIVLVLLGTGWKFIKQILAPRDKRLLLVVVLLQVLAIVAEIVLTEREEGAREYVAWKNFFILMDLFCCVCILVPIFWSIRHLKRTSQVDGKAVMLKLYRYFYIMAVCYIYFTRIMVYLLKITIPFQYGWSIEMFRETIVYLFFVLTVYKFRPASQNLYFAISKDEDVNEVLTGTGATEGLKKVNSKVIKVPLNQQTLLEVTEEEKNALLGMESSHQYD